MRPWVSRNLSKVGGEPQISPGDRCVETYRVRVEVGHGFESPQQFECAGASAIRLGISRHLLGFVGQTTQIPNRGYPLSGYTCLVPQSSASFDIGCSQMALPAQRMTDNRVQIVEFRGPAKTLADASPRRYDCAGITGPARRKRHLSSESEARLTTSITCSTEYPPSIPTIQCHTVAAIEQPIECGTVRTRQIGHVNLVTEHVPSGVG